MSAAGEPIDWAPLDRGLDAYRRRVGRAPGFWLRDDDAVAATPALDRLLQITPSLSDALVLAAIPAGLSATLAPRLEGTAARVAVHGWRHANHAPSGEKKAEFGAQRPLAARRAEAEEGLARLTRAFDARLIPLFVPPWNRIDPAIAPELAALGYRGVSTFKPRAGPWAATGLAQVNTHWDPIDWPRLRAGGPALRPAGALIAELAALLQDPRFDAPAAEPIGLLTHHLVHDAETWAFLEALLMRLEGRVRWRAPLQA
ncbi:MAG: polysaccharide deacetylase family protein [Pseudomonadota bacterium]